MCVMCFLINIRNSCELTKLLWLHVLHRMDAGQVLESPLNAGPLLSGQLIHAFDHLLLFVDPVQVITQHSQTDRLKDVGVLENDTIGPWEANKEIRRVIIQVFLLCHVINHIFSAFVLVIWLQREEIKSWLKV